MKTSETIDKIAPALLAAQKLIGAAKKDAENPFYRSKYADLGEVIQVCKEHLNANGITVLQPVSNGDGDSTYVETILLHESGQFVASTMKVALKDKDNPQAQGSAITYARRYSLQSMILIPAEDDDGEAATQGKEKKIILRSEPKTEREPGDDSPELLSVCPWHKIAWINGKFGRFHRTKDGETCGMKKMLDTLMGGYSKQLGIADENSLADWLASYQLTNWKTLDEEGKVKALDHMADAIAEKLEADQPPA